MTAKTPKEYADELTGEFYDLFSDELENTIAWSEAMACAKLCVEKILDIARESQDPDHIAWWEKVKAVLEKE